MKIDSKGVHCQVVSHPLRRLSRSRSDSAVALCVREGGNSEGRWCGGHSVLPKRARSECARSEGRVLARLGWEGEIEGAMECQPHHAPGGGRKVKGKGDNWQRPAAEDASGVTQLTDAH